MSGNEWESFQKPKEKTIKKFDGSGDSKTLVHNHQPEKMSSVLNFTYGTDTDDQHPQMAGL